MKRSNRIARKPEHYIVLHCSARAAAVTIATIHRVWLRKIEMTASVKCGTLLRRGRVLLEFQVMLRTMMFACVAAAAIAVAAAPTAASARGGGGHGGGGHGGGFHGGGFHGGGFHGGGFHGGGFRGRGFRGFGFGAGFYPYYGAYGYGYDDCYRPVRVITPYGPRWRRVWVCG